VKVIKDEKKPKKNLDSSISFGLLKLDNNEKFTPENIKEKTKKNPPISLNTFIGAFIDSRLTLQNKTKESKKKRAVKKLGKKKLGNQ
jgi:methyl coenzyme M reductase subunit D